MGSDRARNTFDSRQQYRGVVAQQGRVSLEADWNEHQAILYEEARQSTLHTIGGAATPDRQGYLVDVSDPQQESDFSVQPGTMYVGGVRVSLPCAIPYSKQPDWLNAPPIVSKANTREFVYLHVHEQEISAVEDPDLMEVALGGPDTTQRLRLIQHIVRVETSENTCEDALAAIKQAWHKQGQSLDVHTMQLTSQGTLKVGFQSTQQSDAPNSPAAAGGYVGGNNQLLRVQISANRKIVWGYDNASSLYQVTVGKDKKTLTLQTSPVDTEHWPSVDQAVEVLLSTARLPNEAYIASPTGLVTTLAAAYDPGARTVVLKEEIPANYLAAPGQDAEQALPLYLRVWNEEIAFTPKQAVALGSTGLTVTLNGEAFHTGDYWQIAVRQNTPHTVYPERYLKSFQAPEGPRRWIAPLAIIHWNHQRQASLHQDCRKRFQPLDTVTQQQASGCATLTLRPEDVTPERSLQSYVDGYQDRAPVTISLMPGTYKLPRPLVLRSAQSNMTLEGCPHQVILQAEKGAEAHFLDGLIVLCQADNVTLRYLCFELPQVDFEAAGGMWAGVSPHAMSLAGGPLSRDLRTSIGVRPIHCANLTIQECQFRYSVTAGSDVFGVGVFAGSECRGARVERCRFVREEQAEDSGLLRLLVGYLLAPATQFQAEGAFKLSKDSIPAGNFVRPLLQDASFQENWFEGITSAALIYSDAGTVRITGNTVRKGFSGFWLFSLRSLPFHEFVDEDSRRTDPQEQETDDRLNRVIHAFVNSLVYLYASVLARSYPLPQICDGLSMAHVRQAHVEEGAERMHARASETGVAGFVHEIERDSQRFARLFGRFGRPAIPRTPEEAVRPQRDAVTTQHGDPRFRALQRSLFAFEREEVKHETRQREMHLNLHCSGNQIDLVLPEQESGPALLVSEDAEDVNSMLVLGANTMQSQSVELPVALVLFVERCAVTGNLILNEEKRDRKAVSHSLVLVSRSEDSDHESIAVTGNVLRGFLMLLPERDRTPHWKGLNAVM